MACLDDLAGHIFVYVEGISPLRGLSMSMLPRRIVSVLGLIGLLFVATVAVALAHQPFFEEEEQGTSAKPSLPPCSRIQRLIYQILGGDLSCSLEES
jgi:hypothetical protein